MPFRRFRRNRGGVSDVRQTSYTSKPVDVADDFLKTAPADTIPIECRQIRFSDYGLSEYEDCYAVVLENVLSPSECRQLLKYAEASAEGEGWKPAMVNAGYGMEFAALDYRKSDRIIWDSHDIVARIWDRCAAVPAVGDAITTIQGNESVLGKWEATLGNTWKLTRLNERMRFLRYGKGEFFERHCDGSFAVPNHPKDEHSLYTLHLYLSNAKDAKGGATRFFSKTGDNFVDVEPLMGRILIFQHKSLLHSGEEVLKGLKYTMRTDIMYELANPA